MKRKLFLLLFFNLAASGGQSQTMHYPAYVQMQSGRLFDQVVFTFIPPWIISIHSEDDSFKKDLPGKNFQMEVQTPSEGIGVMPVEASAFQQKVLAELEKNSSGAGTAVNRTVYLAKLEKPFKFSKPLSEKGFPDKSDFSKFPKQDFKGGTEGKEDLNETAQTTFFKNSEGIPVPGHLSAMTQLTLEKKDGPADSDLSSIATGVMFSGENGKDGDSSSDNSNALRGNVLLTVSHNERGNGQRDDRNSDFVDVEALESDGSTENFEENGSVLARSEMGHSSALTGSLEVSKELENKPLKIPHKSGLSGLHQLDFSETLKNNRDLMRAVKLSHLDVRQHFQEAYNSGKSGILKDFRAALFTGRTVNEDSSMGTSFLRKREGLLKVHEPSLSRDPVTVLKRIRQTTRNPLSRTLNTGPREGSSFVRTPVVIRRLPTENPLPTRLSRDTIEPVTRSGS